MGWLEMSKKLTNGESSCRRSLSVDPRSESGRHDSSGKAVSILFPSAHLAFKTTLTTNRATRLGFPFYALLGWLFLEYGRPANPLRLPMVTSALLFVTCITCHGVEFTPWQVHAHSIMLIMRDYCTRRPLGLAGGAIGGGEVVAPTNPIGPTRETLI